MANKNELPVEITLSDIDYDGIVESKDQEVIEAINSVPSIRAKQKIIDSLPESARLVKGFPVLTEGTFNGMYYPDEVLQRDAGTWIEHEKPGMTRKSKFGHKSGVGARVGHILNSYYDDGYVKQDILLLDKEAINKWDQGFLDDVSIRALAKVDMENSTSKKIIVKKLRGIGTDFVDKPACKTCGLDVVLAKLEGQEGEVNQVNSNQELEDKDMSGKNEGVKEQIVTMFAELGEKIGKLFDNDEELPVENEEQEEEVQDNPVIEEQEEEPEEESEEPEEEESEEEEDESEEPELEEESGEEDNMKEVFETQLSEMKESFETQLSEIKQMYKSKINELETELADAESKKAEKNRTALVEKYTELSEKFGVEVTEETVAELSDEKIIAQNEAFEIVLSKVPEGELPRLVSLTLEKQKTDIEAELEELEERKRNMFQG